MAEAYLNSLRLTEVSAMSSGTVAASHRERNEASYNLTLELRIVTFSASPRVWSVADIGEPGRVPEAGADTRPYREQALQEVVQNVDRLAAELITA